MGQPRVWSLVRVCRTAHEWDVNLTWFSLAAGRSVPLQCPVCKSWEQLRRSKRLPSQVRRIMSRDQDSQACAQGRTRADNLKEHAAAG